MTDEAIREGFAALKDNAQYQRLYQSARCRSEADWLVGINFTRLFTLRYGTQTDGGPGADAYAGLACGTAAGYRQPFSLSHIFS